MYTQANTHIQSETHVHKLHIHSWIGMTSGMCPGLGEWWLHKEVLNLQTMLKLCLEFLVNTLFYVKWLAEISIFNHADILVHGQ